MAFELTLTWRMAQIGVRTAVVLLVVLAAFGS